MAAGSAGLQRAYDRPPGWYRLVLPDLVQSSLPFYWSRTSKEKLGKEAGPLPPVAALFWQKG